MDPKAPYAELWNGLKRSILRECGLDVLRAPAERIYFEEPYSRPRAGLSIPAKDGLWRERVRAPAPYAREEDEDADVLGEPSLSLIHISEPTNQG